MCRSFNRIERCTQGLPLSTPQPRRNKLATQNGLSRLVPKYSEPFEDTIIAALRTDCEIKNMIANTIKELPVTLLEIKSEAMNDDFITNIKQKITAKNEKVPEVFSLCDNVLLYSETVVIRKKLQKRILEISTRDTRE